MTGVTERTSEPPRLRVRLRARELYSYREILWNLVRKELKVKYTASVLGAVWSLLNPLVFLAVFTFVSNCSGGAVARTTPRLPPRRGCWPGTSFRVGVPAARSP